MTNSPEAAGSTRFGAGFQLQRASGDPRRADKLGPFWPQARSGKLVRLKAEAAALVCGYWSAPGQRRKSFHGLPLGATDPYRQLGQLAHLILRKTNTTTAGG